MILQRAADYYQVLSERNELLSMKMTMLQRIVCSDRVKWLLLAGKETGAPCLLSPSRPRRRPARNCKSSPRGEGFLQQSGFRHQRALEER